MHGKAYGFFDCDASIGELELDLFEIGQDLPENLSLYLTSTHTLISDNRLKRFIQDAEAKETLPRNQNLSPEAIVPKKLANLKYVLEMTQPKQDNKNMAAVLQKLLEDLLAEVCYYREGSKPFPAAVVYQDDGGYVLKE
jgi:hypothetical protein